MIAGVPSQYQRKHPRHSIDEGCTLSWDGARHPCQVVNASIGGALVTTPDLPPLGTTVTLEMAHMGTIAGTVIRNGSSESALRFNPEDAKKVGVNDMITFVLNQDLLDV